jgi:hypothetical protein
MMTQGLGISSWVNLMIRDRRPKMDVDRLYIKLIRRVPQNWGALRLYLAERQQSC